MGQCGGPIGGRQGAPDEAADIRVAAGINVQLDQVERTDNALQEIVEIMGKPPP